MTAARAMLARAAGARDDFSSISEQLEARLLRFEELVSQSISGLSASANGGAPQAQRPAADIEALIDRWVDSEQHDQQGVLVLSAGFKVSQ